MTARRTLRSAAAIVVVAATVLLLGVAPTPAPIPDDPADPVRASEYWLDGARIREAWQTTRGKGVTIAVIDTGIGKVPSVFGDAVVGGTDVSGSGTPDGRTPLGAVDGNHGSWVASLAAGRGAPDGTGMIGVAPEANLLSISVGFSAAAAVPFTEQVAKGMRWAVDNGADIINLSFTTNTLDWDKSWDDAFLYAFEHDVVVVVAAGNRGSGTNIIGAPATIPGVLTVGGVDQTGMASIEASTQGITIGISAPSEGLIGVSADGTVVPWRGTSGAAPIVAGVAALIRSAHPDIKAIDVINRIIKTAIPVPDAVKPQDPLYGYGLVDAAAAISANLPAVSENPMGDLAEWIRVFRRAETEPQPVPTVTPVAVPPLPAPDAPTEAGSPLLPSADSLRYGTLPLIALTVPGILVALGVTAAARRIRSARISVRHTPDSEE
ncbi:MULTISPECIES: S8 family serine peptidase [Microbacterium]|jgi:subtilisin family serine protease|uniref:S8 family serine peptidase n=1 Tax=Microbacterium maritypicum TaxID=33918 RepID=A0A4Y4B8A8_MICMQ|nr:MULTISPECIES: S8 family serine peptidase [Microbacterium]AZS47818.1 Fervidolysin [Microbacterium oxydans]KAB1886809.1 S8 family serine peptidase [Microbacterium liquefaciens]KQV01783.1 peptidase S8 [Microbacterium sp. Root322]QYG10426.1 S8 family serine peptidase [Microbacterium sp. PAMC22086]WKT89330.1 S8 family serine peptidase [Microbacterium liquefaciens]